MLLRDIVINIAQADDELTIYAAKPWTPTSEAIVVSEETSMSDAEISSNYEYFLEIFLAKEFIEDWQNTCAHTPSSEETTTRLILYAETDA